MQNHDDSRPFAPIAPAEWDAAAAAHLARRAGFGARPDEVRRLAALTPEAAVASFVDFPERDEALETRIREASGDLLELGSETIGGSAQEVVERVRAWWVFRMAYGSWPLQEKLTLFWHDHFACQQTKVVRDAMVLAQNQLFRRLAAAPFGELVRAVARDGAMLVFLDNRLNEARNPNENWARELLELFTLGIDRYTQKDVYELARIFTGWSTPSNREGEFEFESKRHDEGDKELLGRSFPGRPAAQGVEEGDEALDWILAQDACAPFLAGKLIAWFAEPDPDPTAVEWLAGELRASGYSVRDALRALFRTRWFYAPERRFALYKNPADVVVSAARLAGVQNLHLFDVLPALRSLGMELFEPPSVAGWELGPAWVNSGSSIHRLNFALHLSQLPHTSREVVGRAALDVDALAADAPGSADAPDSSGGHARIVGALAARLLQRPLEPHQEAAIVECLAEGGAAQRDPDPVLARREVVRAALHLVLSTPQFALA